jgi:hypothetical protein
MGIRFVETDGGRAAAGFTDKDAGDCVVRATAIISGLPYKEVHDALTEWQGWNADAGGNVVGHFTHKKFILSLGFVWIPLMQIGSGCKVHLRADELPLGRIIVRVSHHIAAVIDRVLYDTHDCSRDGKRCVYGYFTKESI